ncbi:MAG: hypothetical protein M1826_007437 [Phylliscum demangeonii]|nr:MAG: hypothetical protein M1826_007437 [Phylliscum demangeonii]
MPVIVDHLHTLRAQLQARLPPPIWEAFWPGQGFGWEDMEHVLCKVTDFAHVDLERWAELWNMYRAITVHQHHQALGPVTFSERTWTEEFVEIWWEVWVRDESAKGQTESIWRGAQHALDLHYHVLAHALRPFHVALLARAQEVAHRPALRDVAGPVCFLLSYDLKLRARANSLLECQRCFRRHLARRFEPLSGLDPAQTWIDVAREDTPVGPAATCLMQRTCCLEAWLARWRNWLDSACLQSQVYCWALTQHQYHNSQEDRCHDAKEDGHDDAEDSPNDQEVGHDVAQEDSHHVAQEDSHHVAQEAGRHGAQETQRRGAQEDVGKDGYKEVAEEDAHQDDHARDKGAQQGRLAQRCRRRRGKNPRSAEAVMLHTVEVEEELRQQFLHAIAGFVGAAAADAAVTAGAKLLVPSKAKARSIQQPGTRESVIIIECVSAAGSIIGPSRPGRAVPPPFAADFAGPD